MSVTITFVEPGGSFTWTTGGSTDVPAARLLPASIGTDGQVATVVAGAPAWADPTESGAVDSVDGRTGAVTLDDLYAGADDPRLTDARTPTGGAGGFLSGSYPNPGANTEAVQDLVAAFLAAGTGVTLTYDDTAGTLTVAVNALALTNVTEVASQAAMLALDVQPGDIAVRSDLPATFVLSGSDPTVLANWVQLATPTDVVLSVNGQTGAVSIPADGTAGTASLRTLGTSATQAAAGNDSRLSDQRTPIDGSVTIAKHSATGTPSSTTYLRGDGTWSTPASGSNYATRTYAQTNLNRFS